jgi:hypothetical protein
MLNLDNYQISFNSIWCFTKSMKYAVIIAAVFAVGLLFVGANLSADAAKSSGTKNQQFGKGSQIQVCGTHFCASDPSLKKHVDHEKNKPTQDDLRALFNRMDKIHKQHQDQLLDKWRLMTNAERVQFIKQMNEMMTKMESIDMATHMEQMLGDQHDASHTKMKDQVHKKTKTGN